MTPRKFKTKEKTTTAKGKREYQRLYMREIYSHLKAKHSLQAQWDKAIEDRFIQGQSQALATITFSQLYQIGQKIRDIDNFDEINKLYRELWKKLEVHEAKLKGM